MRHTGPPWLVALGSLNLQRETFLMYRRCRGPAAYLAGVSFTLLSLSGCQTWVGGMTLPTGHYLEHPPQYIPPSPPFPLSRELAAQEASAAAAIPGAVVGQGAAGAILPPPVPAPPGP
jgi:hypothetical protein